MRHHPNLPGKLDPALIRFPCYAHLRPSGMFASVVGGTLLSSNAKPIRNRFLQSWCQSWSEIEGCDGWLTVSTPNNQDATAQPKNLIITEWTDDFDHIFWLQDFHDQPSKTYLERRGLLYSRLMNFKFPNPAPKVPNVRILSSHLMNDQQNLDRFREQAIKAGYPGVVTNDPNSHYKHGRSTARSQEMLEY